MDYKFKNKVSHNNNDFLIKLSDYCNVFVNAKFCICFTLNFHHYNCQVEFPLSHLRISEKDSYPFREIKLDLEQQKIRTVHNEEL